jgi:hypothetical protein
MTKRDYYAALCLALAGYGVALLLLMPVDGGLTFTLFLEALAAAALAAIVTLAALVWVVVPALLFLLEYLGFL